MSYVKSNVLSKVLKGTFKQQNRVVHMFSINTTRNCFSVVSYNRSMCYLAYDNSLKIKNDVGSRRNGEQQLTMFFFDSWIVREGQEREHDVG